MIEFLQTDDATPFAIDPGLQAGQTTATAAGHLWWQRGQPQGQDLTDLVLFLLAEHPLGSAQRVANGLPPLDELWARLRFVGQDNTADPSQQNFLTGWQRIGATRPVLLPSLHAGCARFFELELDVPSHATETPYKLLLDAQISVHAVALPAGAADFDAGVLAGYGDARHSGLVRGGEITGSAPPDDRVHVAARHYVFQGAGYGQIQSEITLDQLAAQGPLAPGQSYLSVLGLDETGVIVLKGDGAAAPVEPELPAGAIFLGRVTVEHQAGGVSILEAQDLSGSPTYDRHRLRPGEGLNVEVHAGITQAGGTRRFWSGIETLPVPASATSAVWQLASGLYAVTAGDAPDETAFWIGEVATDTTAVVAVRQHLPLAGRAERAVIAGPTPATPGLLGETTWLGPRMWIDTAALAVSDAGSGTGATRGDWQINGASIYPGSVIDDQRPVVPVGSSELLHDAGIPELIEVRHGDRLSFHLVEVPSGPPARSEGYLILRG